MLGSLYTSILSGSSHLEGGVEVRTVLHPLPTPFLYYANAVLIMSVLSNILLTFLQSDKATDRWLNFLLQESEEDDDDDSHNEVLGPRRLRQSSHEETMEEDDDDSYHGSSSTHQSRICQWGLKQGPRRGQNNGFHYINGAEREREREREREIEEGDLRDPLESDSSIIVISANYNIRNKNGNGNGSENGSGNRSQYIDFTDNML